mmetsp:Transcript_4455/g.6668  ORF Transcript_4455/g.6668 Transcript_4455/m.6668 type:complete len:516 (+) Transcript_4455:81-1628(+)
MLQMKGVELGVVRRHVSETSVSESVASYPEEENVKPWKMRQLDMCDQVLEECGVGMFQVFILVLCGLGYFVESAEYHLASVLYPLFVDLWKVQETDLAVISSLTSLGMMIGAIGFGRLSDVKGRKFVYQYSLLVSVLFGFLSSYGNDVTSFAILRFLMGIGYGGNLVSTTPYLMELTPSSYRQRITLFSFAAFAVGSLYIIAISWGFLSIIGWEWVVRITSIVGLPVILGLFLVAPESIRFCVSVGRYEDAVKGCRLLCKMNRCAVPTYFTVEKLRALEDESCEDHVELVTRRYNPLDSRLCGPEYVKILLPLLLVWFLNAFALAMHSFMPLVLKLELGEQAGDSFQYQAMLAAQIGDFGGIVVLFCFFAASRVSLIKEVRSGILAEGLCVLFLGIFPMKKFFALLMVGLGRTGTVAAMHGLYTYSPAMFPTSLRVSAFSYCQLAHRLAPVFSPYLFTMLDEKISFSVTMFVFAAFFLAAAFIALFLKPENINLNEESDFEREHRMVRLPTAGDV